MIKAEKGAQGLKEFFFIIKKENAPWMEKRQFCREWIMHVIPRSILAFLHMVCLITLVMITIKLLDKHSTYVCSKITHW